MHRSATWTGIGFLVFAALNGAALLAADRVADTLGRRPVMVAGCAISRAGLLLLAVLPVTGRSRRRAFSSVSEPGAIGSGHGIGAMMPGTLTRVSVQLNHTIVSCRDQQRSAEFLTGILGLPAATRFAHFLVVAADNGVSLDFAETTGAITPQHYAFLVGEEEFDAAFARIRDQGLPYWADPGQGRPQVINHRDGGRGLYFEDPDGHLLEIITRPYGSGG